MASILVSTGNHPVTRIYTDPVPPDKVAAIELGDHIGVVFITQDDVDTLVAALLPLASKEVAA